MVIYKTGRVSNRRTVGKHTRNIFIMLLTTGVSTIRAAVILC